MSPPDVVSDPSAGCLGPGLGCYLYGVRLAGLLKKTASSFIPPPLRRVSGRLFGLLIALNPLVVMLGWVERENSIFSYVERSKGGSRSFRGGSCEGRCPCDESGKGRGTYHEDECREVGLLPLDSVSRTGDERCLRR